MDIFQKFQAIIFTKQQQQVLLMPNYSIQQTWILTTLSKYIKRFCLEFFGLKNQTREHVSFMSLNEPPVWLLC